MSGLVCDFATRLAAGLALVLWLSPWASIPPRYFRTQCNVLLGLYILAAFDLGFNKSRPGLLAVAIAACVLAYAGAVFWGLGLDRLGRIALVGLCAAGAVLQLQRIAWQPIDWLAAATRAGSAFLLGASLAAMLLGHHYLTAPAMSVDPLKRFIKFMAAGLVVQAALAAIAWNMGQNAISDSAAPLYLSMRWGLGLIGPAIGTFLAWRTALLRSTQSATGILYATSILVMLGELSGLVLGATSAGTSVAA